MDNQKIDIQNLYRVPWSKNDNPNAWIEITTSCNLKCPGCYRGCHLSTNKSEHKPLEEIKNEVLLLKKIRNCHSLIISGGEPLTHPEILKIVEFVKQQQLNPVIITNGTLINKEILKNLKTSGLIGLIIRIDSLRDSNSESFSKDEIELNQLRQKYADLVYSIGGLSLGFTCVISKKNLPQIPDIIKWVQENNKKVDILILIAKRDVMFSKNQKINKKDWVYLPEICEEISKKIPELSYSAYLGSEKEDETIRWLFSFWLSLDKKILGYLDKRVPEICYMFYHLKNGRYYYILEKRKGLIHLFKIIPLAIINKSLRAISKSYLMETLKNPLKIFKKSHLQIICIIQPPSSTEGERDICDSCPDATLYNGKLYASCILEEIKNELDTKIH
ncbi:MAG: radical SAM protein [Nanoarchaeota archaeon]|nr:radical SAM protein [Nanoarchaeota archaeon]